MRDEVRLSMRTGVPRSVLLGRVVKRGEPLWLSDDIDYLLALQADEDTVCSGCGEPMGEAWDDTPKVTELYDADLYWCGGCAAVDRGKRRAATKEDPGSEPTDGLKILSKRDSPVGGV